MAGYGTADLDESVYPKTIRVSERVVAHRFHRHYTVSTPYDSDVSAYLGSFGVPFDRSAGGWVFPCGRVDTMRRAMEHAETILTEKRPSRPAIIGKMIVAVGGYEAGDVLERDGEMVAIEKFSRSFVGSRSLSRQGLGDLVGKEVCYAYLRELTAEEVIEIEEDTSPTP